MIESHQANFGFSFFNRSAGNLGHIVVPVGEEEAIRQSIVSILSAEKGERPLFPEYGSDLRGYIFQKSNQELFESIRKSAYEALSTNETRIELNEIKVSEETGSPQRLELLIRYEIISTNQKQSVVFPLRILE